MSFAAIRLARINRAWLCIAAMLLVHFVLGLDAACRLSVTHDEYWHLPAGLAAWKTGRFDADNLNPPLTRLWDAIPLLFTSARIDRDIPPGDAFRLGDSFLAANRQSYERDLLLARGMNLLFSIVTGVVIALWANALFGTRSACLAAVLWSCCPTALAHGALVTPDMGCTCLFASTLFASWRFSRDPGWRRAAILGILLGLAQLTKFTSLLLYPLCVVTWFVVRWRQRGTATIDWRKVVAQWAAVFVLSLTVLNAGYLFHGSFRPLRSYDFQSQALGEITELLRPIAAIPLPLPRDYLEGFDRQKRMMEAPHPVYLDGKWSLTGFGDYYARALLYKVPHSVQGLCALSLLFLLFPAGLPRMGRVQALLWIPFLAIVGTASLIGMQLGIRYILPGLPFLYLFTAQSARWLDWNKFRVRTLLTVALAVLLPFSLRFHPEQLAYFNEFAGGPRGGRAHLLDSNLDWGQDLGALARYLKQHEIGEIGLAYFGMAPPAELGIPYHLPPREPEPGWYAVSANFSRGRPHTLRQPDGSFRPADVNEFRYFQDFVPVGNVGASIDVYHVSADDVANWRKGHARTPG